MGIFQIYIMSVGLAMDAFAVSICKGLSMPRMSWKNAIITGLYFGIFQAVMPLIGYYLGTWFHEFLTSVDHWITFGLLVYLGINMILSSDDDEQDDSFNFKSMVPLAIATSIDALAVGITLAFFYVDIYRVVFLIGIMTFLFCTIGVRLGYVFGSRHRKIATIFGGMSLIFIGFSILLEQIL